MALHTNPVSVLGDLTLFSPSASTTWSFGIKSCFWGPVAKRDPGSPPRVWQREPSEPQTAKPYDGLIYAPGLTRCQAHRLVRYGKGLATYRTSLPYVGPGTFRGPSAAAEIQVVSSGLFAPYSCGFLSLSLSPSLSLALRSLSPSPGCRSMDGKEQVAQSALSAGRLLPYSVPRKGIATGLQASSKRAWAKDVCYPSPCANRHRRFPGGAQSAWRPQRLLGGQNNATVVFAAGSSPAATNIRSSYPVPGSAALPLPCPAPPHPHSSRSFLFCFFSIPATAPLF